MTDIKIVSIEDIVSELKNPEQENTVRLLENACVSAGAGSGKTRVLATRYVYLVAKYGYMPSEILTLTFTNKAANEMYSRIYKSLLDYSQKVTEPNEKENLLKAIGEFQEAKIQTLDSYCKSLVSSNIHKFGITPDFSLDTKLLKEKIKQKAVEFLLENNKNPYLQFFLGTKWPEKFAKDFFVDIVFNNSTISKPIDFFGNYTKQIDFAKTQWEKWAKKVNQLLVDLKKDFEEFGNNAKDSVKPKLQDLMDKIDFIECEENPDNLVNNSKFETWYNWFYSFSKLRKNSEGELSSYVENAREILSEMMSYFNFLYYKEELKGISELLAKFQIEVEKIKRGMGLLSFSDVASLSIDCLLKYPEVREIEKKSYKAIMIDEFQDDNILQKELLYLLAEKEGVCSSGIPSVQDLNPNKLFFVGDEKQSIYKFRGADVEVFRALSSELPGKATLSTNYRSVPSLIAAFNSVFGGVQYPVVSEDDIKKIEESNLPLIGGVFKENSPELEAYEACYNLTKAPATKLENANFDRTMHFVMVKEKTKSNTQDEEYYSPEESEAYFVAKKIKDLLNVYEPRDIAILSYSTTKQHIYERFLKMFGIGYSCGKQKSFFYDAPINDIIAFLRVCIYQDDLLAILSYLNSPFVRLSEDSSNLVISLLAAERKEKKYFESPFYGESARKILDMLPDCEKEKYQLAIENVEKLHSFIKNHNIAQTISYIFYNFGYCYETMWDISVTIYAELYDFLFALATTADSNEKNLSDFILDLENMEKHPNDMEDISIPLERGNTVQIMTIHGSKGLEFPVVFVVGLNDKSKGYSDDKAACYNEEFGVAVKLPLHSMLDSTTKKSWVFELTRDEEIKKELAETRRVLYVAITRAEKELYLVGNLNTPSSTNFYSLLKPILEKYVDGTTQTAKPDAPFSYEEIDVFEVNSSSLQGNNGIGEKRCHLIKEKSLDYENAEICEMPIIISNKVNPSKVLIEDILSEKEIKVLENNQTVYNFTNLFPNLETDEIIKKEVEKKGKEIAFNNANFGTIAHAYIEHFFKNKDKAHNIDLKFPAVLVEKLSPTLFEKVKADAKLLANSFLESTLGKMAYNSDWCKSEYDFKFAININEKLSIIDGQMDLIFKENESGKVYVVDFKSDGTVNPKEHFVQLALYKKAAAALCNVEEEKVEVYVYYLRFGEAVNMEGFAL